ncbi:MAG TPA: TetR/AcrR family transcriptional regulator [Polyangiaceae bacterium]|nr:TetR/AcrR family transcriptional regulator [Polyangiaceae bacterium]
MPRRPRTAPRKKPRQGRSQATVETILDATARVLCTTGYDRASTNRVALAAGVSVGSLYQYFPSKEALVAALAARHMAKMTALVRTKLAEVAAEPMPVAVRTIIGAMFEAHQVDPKLHKVLIEEVPRIGRLENLRGVEKETECLVAALLESRRSELRRSDTEVVAFMLVAAVEAVTHASVVAEHEPARARLVADELADLVLRYLVE